MEFDIPDTNAFTQPHLRHAAKHVASFASKPNELHCERIRKLSVLKRVATKMAPTTRNALKFASPLGFPIAKRFHSGLILVLLTAASYADTTMSFDVVQGVPNFGDIPATGSHAPCEVPATHPKLDPFYARKLIGSMRRKASKANAE